MKRISILLISILVAILCAAQVYSISLSITPTNVVPTDNVALTVTDCGEGKTTFIRVFSPGESSQLVDLFQGTVEDGSFSAQHTAQSETGKYTVQSTCADSSSTASGSFCVGGGCASSTTTIQPTTSQGTSTGDGGGGSSSSSSSKRSSPGSAPTVTCVPSWVCNEWSACIDEKQRRNCIDYNSCTGKLNKPVTERVCESVTSSLQQTQVAAPPGVNPSRPSSIELSQPRQKSYLPFIAGGIAVIVLISGIVIVKAVRRSTPA